MRVLSRMEKMVQDRYKDATEPVLNEYKKTSFAERLSTKAVISLTLCVILIVTMLMMPLDNQIIIWTRLGLLITIIFTIIAIITDRILHLHR